MTTTAKQMRFKGLTSTEIEASRQKYGANILTPPKRDPWWKLFLEKFDDPVIRILIIAAMIAIAVGFVDGKYFEGIGIIIAVLLATVLAFLNEYKANREFDILNKVNDEVLVKVVRNSNFSNVPRRDIVVGDVILIEVGEEVPADALALEAVNLQVDESRLTGESVPVNKVPKAHFHTLAVKERAYPADKLLRGTNISDGHGFAEVVAVGDSSEIGKTAIAAAEETGEQTPLNAQLERLSKLIGVIGFSVAALIFVALIFRGVIISELQLNSQHWFFTAVLTAGVALALIRVWLPIVYDAFEVFGKEVEPPSWLEKEGLVSWLKTFAIGLAVFGAGIGIGYGLGLVSLSPREWLPHHVVDEFLTYFMIAVTVIVVAVPEGLAMSVTLSLAYSVRKMTASNNLVRQMHACETIGAATVICSDKTGTLTLNEMHVAETSIPYLTGNSLKEDIGYAQELLIEGIAANSTAHLSKLPGEDVRALGNPTEGALLLWLEDQGIDYVIKRDSFSIIYQWTFSTERKYMATVGESPTTGKTVLHLKGAPEIVMECCSKVMTVEGAIPIENSRSLIEKSLKEYQARGMRTLAFAYHETPRNHEGVTIEEVASDMTWLGFVAIADPVRPEVPLAIKTCRKAGLLVKIVTGDNSETAQEIARQIGLWEDSDGRDCHMTGREFAQLSESDAKEVVNKLKVLSRARPMDKLRLVKLLQEHGHVVAVTGDGVNDGPALNHADVGLAMGKTGTAVAKEASDIILLDDSFRSIAQAVLWGRSLYQNIQRFILFQLTVNVAALGVALLGPFIGVKLPLTVTQMLWVNLIMDTFAALALATEPPHMSVMNRPPRSPKDFIISNTMAKSILAVGILFLTVLTAMLLYIQRDGIVTDYELSVFFTVFVMLQFWNLFNARCLALKQSAFSMLWQSKSFIMIATAIFVGQILMVQFGGNSFRTVPLSLQDWLIIIGLTSIVLWGGELWRRITRLRSPELEYDPA